MPLQRDQKQKERPMYIFSGSLDCDGVFIDDLATFVFQLEYTGTFHDYCKDIYSIVTLPKPDGTKHMWNIVLGWRPFIIVGLSGNNIKMVETLVKGPGKSLLNQKLYETNPEIKEL